MSYIQAGTANMSYTRMGTVIDRFISQPNLAAQSMSRPYPEVSVGDMVRGQSGTLTVVSVDWKSQVMRVKTKDKDGRTYTYTFTGKRKQVGELIRLTPMEVLASVHAGQAADA